MQCWCFFGESLIDFIWCYSTSQPTDRLLRNGTGERTELCYIFIVDSNELLLDMQRIRYREGAGVAVEIRRQSYLQLHKIEWLCKCVYNIHVMCVHLNALNTEHTEQLSPLMISTHTTKRRTELKIWNTKWWK